MPSENTTTYAILGLLHHEPLSGYDIRKRIESSIGLFWDAGYGQIYPTLKRLAEDGLVEGRAERNGRRPDRTVYAITPDGQEQLRQWLEKPAAKEHVRYEVLLKLFFGSLVEARKNVRTIEEFRARYRHLPGLLEGYEKELRLVMDESPDHLYRLLTVRFGQRIYQAYLEWAEEAVNLIQHGGVE